MEDLLTLLEEIPDYRVDRGKHHNLAEIEGINLIMVMAQFMHLLAYEQKSVMPQV